jgi:hypothetical protein
MNNKIEKARRKFVNRLDLNFQIFNDLETQKLFIYQQKKLIKSFGKLTFINKTINHNKKLVKHHKKFDFEVKNESIKKVLCLEPEVFFDIVARCKEKYKSFQMRNHITIVQLLFVTLSRLK